MSELDLSKFELFERPTPGVWLRRPAAINITPDRKALSLNANALDLLKEPSHVAFYVSRASREVGIRPCAPEAPGAKRVSKGRAVSAVALIDDLALIPGTRPVQMVKGHLIFSMDPPPEYVTVDGVTHPVLELAQAEFDRLLDYSASIPTGKTIGKRWKRCILRWRDDEAAVADVANWRIGEYTRLSKDYPGDIDITWYMPRIVEPGQVDA